MEKKELRDELDPIIDDILRVPPDLMIPDSFTDDLVKKLERQIYWRELLSEFGIKIALAAGALIILMICLIFPARYDPRPWIDWILRNGLWISGLVGIVIFTILFDQILLKYMLRTHKR